MKFFTITVVSLSMGCQVLAAPIDTAPTVAGIEPTVKSVPSEALAVVGDLPVVSTLTPGVPETGYPTKGPIFIATITSAVSGLKSSISSELTTIGKSRLAFLQEHC